ncbi:MAG: hypothetical protein R2799_13400 [Crocinitomicaceae bacterium]
MKNTILVAAATAFVTTIIVLFIVAMAKGPGGCHGHGGHQMQMHHGGGMHHGNMGCGGHGGGHGQMHKGTCGGHKGMKGCSGSAGACKGDLEGKEVKIEKKVIIEDQEK